MPEQNEASERATYEQSQTIKEPDVSDCVIPNSEKWDQAICSLCDGSLYIEWTASRAIYARDTVTDLADPAGAHSSSWQVVCGNGHVLVLPPPTARDSYTFGECICEPTDPESDEDCGHGDMQRLRSVVGGRRG